MKTILILPVVIASLTAGLSSQAAVVTTGSFQNPGNYTNVTLSGTSTTGFTATYNTTQADTRFYSAATLNGGSGVTLNIGDSLTFSFDWTSTVFPSTAINQGISLGFDVGSGLFRAQLDTGTPAGNLLYLAYGDTYQFGAIAGAQTSSFSTPTPGSSSYFVAGNTVSLTATLTRTASSNWTFSVAWGGQTYTQTIVGYVPATNDFTIDSVWVGSGQSTGAYFVNGDNYTVGNVSVNAVPEPQTAAMLLLGGGILILSFRSKRRPSITAS